MKTPLLQNKRSFYNYLRSLEFLKGMVISESKLKVEKLLVNGENSLTYDLNQSESGVLPTETKIANNDLFFPVFWGMYLVRRTVDANNVPTQVGIMRSYPNPLVFPGAGEAPSLQNYYGGRVDLTIDTTKVLNGFATEKFLYQPDTQEGVAQSTALTGANLRDQFRYDEIARDFVPGYGFSGTNSNTLTFTLPKNMTPNTPASQAQGIGNFLGFMFDGFLIIGGAKAYDQFKAAVNR